ncbi:MAG: response regulator transcription factor [Ignavibacteriaceae bacterium]
MKILIADDHAIIREGLKQILIGINDIEIIDEASNGKEVLTKVRSEFYDIVVLDISMPDMNGLDILKQLKTEQPDLHVLILSIHPEDQYALRVLKAGASGYLTKTSAPEELVKAIVKISAGGKYISESLADFLSENLEGKKLNLPHESLSDREYEVMCLIASGKTSDEIAKKLFISSNTVRTYRTRILEKMNMSDNSQIITYCIKNNLID